MALVISKCIHVLRSFKRTGRLMTTTYILKMGTARELPCQRPKARLLDNGLIIVPISASKNLWTYRESQSFTIFLSLHIEALPLAGTTREHNGRGFKYDDDYRTMSAGR